MVNEYDWWNGACKAVAAGTLDSYFKTDVITADEPKSGRYKFGSKNKTTGEVTFTPIAYWYENGLLRCRLGDTMLEDVKARHFWPFCAKRPITNELYRTVLDHGAKDGGYWTWPADPQSTSRSNNAPEDDSFEGLTAAIENLAGEAKRLIDAGKATTQLVADQAGNLANDLLKLWNKADGKRKIEKAPHKKAVDDVDDKWRPALTTAAVYEELKTAVLAPFLKAEKKKRDDAASAALAAAAQAQRDADEAHLKLAEAASTGDTTILKAAEKEAAQVFAKAEAAATTAEQISSAAPVKAGDRGRGVNLRGNKVAKITDYDKLLLALKDHTEVRALVQAIANRSAKAGIPLAGMEITTEDSAT